METKKYNIYKKNKDLDIIFIELGGSVEEKQKLGKAKSFLFSYRLFYI